MKNISFLVFSILFILNFSCTSDDSQIVESFWIDSIRVNCTGVTEQTCYKIQENMIIDETKWELFYSSIQNFDEQYEAGYVYKISVTKINIDNPPADASSVKYILNKVISKELDD